MGDWFQKIRDWISEGMRERREDEKGENEREKRENRRKREKGSYLDWKLGSSMSSIHSITFH